MKKIEFVIRPSKLEAVTEALGGSGVKGMTVTHVTGCGEQQGKTEVYRGSSYNVNLLPKVKVEIVVKDELVDKIVGIIVSTAKTGQIGDGKIFIYSLENAVRIRTGEQGEEAI